MAAILIIREIQHKFLGRSGIAGWRISGVGFRPPVQQKLILSPPGRRCDL